MPKTKSDSKECFNCKHCYNKKECTLFDELILIAGHCYMWNKR